MGRLSRIGQKLVLRGAIKKYYLGACIDNWMFVLLGQCEGNALASEPSQVPAPPAKVFYFLGFEIYDG
jgi:hypothetical protein